LSVVAFAADTQCARRRRRDLPDWFSAGD